MQIKISGIAPFTLDPNPTRNFGGIGLAISPVGIFVMLTALGERGEKQNNGIDYS